MQKIILESLIVGLITSILGTLIIKILIKINSIEQHDCIKSFIKKYKKMYILEISLFLTGVIIHLLLEYIGLNKWYCEKKCAGEGKSKKCKIVCNREKPSI